MRTSSCSGARCEESCEVPVGRASRWGPDLMGGPGGGEVCTPSNDPEAEEGGPPCRAGRPQRPPSGPQGPARGRPLSLPEAAAYLNVAERYMRRLVTERRIPYFKVGRLLRFSAEDLDAFLEAGRVESGTPHPLLVPRRGR